MLIGVGPTDVRKGCSTLAVDLGRLVAQYLQLRLYEHDLEEALRTLKALKRMRSNASRQIVIRDFIVCYSRPFSGNQDADGKPHRLEKGIVPAELLEVHESIIAARNQLFAHADWEGRVPRVADWSRGDQLAFPMSIRPPKYQKLLGEVSAMRRLAQTVLGGITASFPDIERRIHEMNTGDDNRDG